MIGDPAGAGVIGGRNGLVDLCDLGFLIGDVVVDRGSQRLAVEKLGAHRDEQEFRLEDVRFGWGAERLHQFPRPRLGDRIDLAGGLARLALLAPRHAAVLLQPRQCRIDRSEARIDEIGELRFGRLLLDLVARRIPELEDGEA